MSSILGAAVAPFIATWLATTYGVGWVGVYLLAAAVLILQGALDLESSSGHPAGELVSTGRKPRHARRRKEHG